MGLGKEPAGPLWNPLQGRGRASETVMFVTEAQAHTIEGKSGEEVSPGLVLTYRNQVPES